MELNPNYLPLSRSAEIMRLDATRIERVVLTGKGSDLFRTPARCECRFCFISNVSLLITDKLLSERYKKISSFVFRPWK